MTPCGLGGAPRNFRTRSNHRKLINHQFFTITVQRQLFRELVTEQANGQEIIFKVRKQFAIVACRFMIHCSRALDQNRVHKTLEPQYTSMITDCEKILNWISTRTMKIPAGNLPANDIVPNLRQQNWTVVHLRSEDWRKVMQASPFTVAQNQLAVPRP